jgi:hypothetical protein
MSAKSRAKRAKYEASRVDGPEPAQADDEKIDAWVPDYGRSCEVCGQTPCVTGVRAGRVVYEGTMCGVCTWGEAACLDPARW